MERVTKGFCNPRISIAKDPLRCNSRSEQVHKTTSLNVEPRTPYHAFVGRMPTIYWIKPTYRFPKVSSYAIRCWGYTGSTAQSTLNLHPGVSILQHITSLSRKLCTSDLWKASTITSYGNTPELPPQYWVMSGLSCHWPYRRDFRCRPS